MFAVRHFRLVPATACYCLAVTASVSCGETNTPERTATTDSSTTTPSDSLATSLPAVHPTTAEPATSSSVAAVTSTSPSTSVSTTTVAPAPTSSEPSNTEVPHETAASDSESTSRQPSSAELSESATDVGSDSTSAASVVPSPGEFAGAMDGLLYKGDCATSDAADECYPAGCVDGVFEQNTKVTLAGDPLVTYEIQLHVYGVVELRKGYSGGTRRQGTTGNAQSAKDFWYEGGSFQPGNYNVYTLRVTPAVAGVPNAADNGNNYFLNARDDSNEGHEVWELNYTAAIRAQGGSELAFRAYDQNCTQIQNVGSSARPSRGDGADGALVVTLSSAEPAPVDFVQPLHASGGNGQWVYIDVLSVSEFASR